MVDLTVTDLAPRSAFDGDSNDVPACMPIKKVEENIAHQLTVELNNVQHLTLADWGRKAIMQTGYPPIRRIVTGHDARHVAKVLLDKGADANVAAVGYTALHVAVLRSDLDLVKALLAHQAGPNTQMTTGTPVRRNSQDFELPKTLIGATPYLLAAKFLEADIMRALAAAGADTRLPMKDGATPLMAAAGMGITAPVQDEKRGTDRRGLAILDGGKVEPDSQVLEAVSAALALGSTSTPSIPPVTPRCTSRQRRVTARW
jgi:hypothetical protein